MRIPEFLSETRPPGLPRPRRRDGRMRRVGVEIEFGGLAEAAVAKIAAATLGGAIHEVGPHALEVRDSEIGDIRIELDTKYRDRRGAVAEIGLDLARAVVPVEIVTPPLPPAAFARLEGLRAALHHAGATGSRGGLLLGFGVHFNPEVRSETVADILPVLRAYALLEDWLRARMPIDPTRRLLPFVDRYPPDLLDALAARDAADWPLARVIGVYLDHVGSRNHGLDCLPLFAHLDRATVQAALGEAGLKGARPAWHFRLPDCRIDEPDWRLAEGWGLWCAVERAAIRPALLERLAAAWRDRRAALLPAIEGWAVQAGEILAADEGGA